MEMPEPIEIIYVEEDELFEIVYAVRASVFQGELGLPEEADLDGHEHISHHYLAVIDGNAVGAARWRMTMAGKVKLERFAVVAEHRGKGVGKALLEAILRQAPKSREVYLESLLPVTGFFAKAGFEPVGDAFDHLGFQHQKMKLKAG